MFKKQYSILVCEDDVNYGMLLTDYLLQKGYSVDYAQDGEVGWQKFCEAHYDFCILDVMMPARNGFELAKAIRMTTSQVPIIFLTARNSIEDMIEGYKSGCDDYVTKPCPMNLLMCKIEAVLRRYNNQQMMDITVYHLGKIVYNTVTQTLTIGKETHRLSSRENELLRILTQSLNQLVEKNVILTSIWHTDSYFTNRSLSVYVNHLRSILAVDSKVKLLNVHGKGYKLIVPEVKELFDE